MPMPLDRRSDKRCVWGTDRPASTCARGSHVFSLCLLIPSPTPSRLETVPRKPARERERSAWKARGKAGNGFRNSNGTPPPPPSRADGQGKKGSRGKSLLDRKYRGAFQGVKVSGPEITSPLPLFSHIRFLMAVLPRNLAFVVQFGTFLRTCARGGFTRTRGPMLWIIEHEKVAGA